MHAWRPTTILLPKRTLIGEHVVLRPLTRRDLPDISQVPEDPAFDLLLRPPVGAGVSAVTWLEDAVRCARRGTERCWTIRDRADGRLLGSTRLLNVDLANRRLEIGATWLLAEARGTCANAESKLLLLDHAFHDLGVARVHIQADAANARSRAAIESLGATAEGVLRQHAQRRDGTMRDTAVYSIIAEEWPDLRPALEARVAGRTPAWRERGAALGRERAARATQAAWSAAAITRAAAEA